MNITSRAAALALISASGCIAASAQQVSIGTDLLKTASGTLNLDADIAVQKNLKFTSEVTYNPWNRPIGQNKSRSMTLGIRYNPIPDKRPGVWIESGLSATEFSRSPHRISNRLEEGTSAAAYGGFGYSFNLPYGFRLDAGAFMWGGIRRVETYSCRVCGEMTSKKTQAFILPKEIRLTVSRPIFSRHSNE